ncbi:hypothetical protein LTR95_001513 [Oleoguttula sp. CCFEE 5521]
MVVSDSEAAERPVREQLKKASIGNSEEARLAAKDVKMAGSTVPSADEVVVEDGADREGTADSASAEPTATATNGKHHTRKRSRDSLAEENELNGYKRKVSAEVPRDDVVPSGAQESNSVTLSTGARPARAPTPDRGGDKADDAVVESYASPKTKRTRLQTEPSEQKLSEGSDGKSGGDRTKPTALPAGSGFANISSTSPFGALASSDTATKPQPLGSAFSSSAFGALSGSSTSGFGALGKATTESSSGSVFGSGAKSPLGESVQGENAKPELSSFGGALGQKSVFADTSSAPTNGFAFSSSGFGKVGQSSGFGAAASGSAFGGLGGSGLTSFASSKPSTFASSSKPAKTFGAPTGEDDAAEEEDGTGDDDAGYKSPLSTEDDQRDERFYAQEIETGEEDEVTQYTTRAKLYNFVTLPDGSKKEWRERGLGALKLNVKRVPSEDGDAEESSKVRLLMRADGSHRVVLNTPVNKDIKFGAPSGGPPTSGVMLFMGTVEGGSGLEILQLKLKQQFALELHQKIEDLQATMS